MSAVRARTPSKDAHCAIAAGTPYPLWITLFTSMFMHGGWAHILGNMVYLFVFGNHVERSMGHVRYLAYYDPLTALPNAPLGPQHLTMKLRYQACSTEICLPPVTKDVDATISVVADRSAAKAAHPEVFNSK